MAISFFVNNQAGFATATAALTSAGIEDFESSSLGAGQGVSVDDPLAPGVANGVFATGTKTAVGVTVQSHTNSDPAIVSPRGSFGLSTASAGFLGTPDDQVSVNNKDDSFDIFVDPPGSAPVTAVRLTPLFFDDAGVILTDTLTVTVYDTANNLLGSTTIVGGNYLTEASFIGIVVTGGASIGRININDGTAAAIDYIGADDIEVFLDANTPPAVNHNTGLTLAEGATGTITAAQLDFDDAEQADTAIVYTLVAGATNGTLFKSGGALGAGGTFTQDDINNNRITYTHDGSETTSASFGFSVSDGAGGSVTSQTFSFTVTPVNDDPAIAGLTSDLTVVLETPSNIDLSGATFSDVDSGASNVTFTLAASAGTLAAASGGSVTVGGSGTGTLTLTGTAANIDAFLNTASNIQYTSPAVSAGDSATLTLTANDGGATGSGGGGTVALGDVTLFFAEQPSLVVTTLDDVVDAFDGETSLREAIAHANGLSGADTITFASGLTGTIRLDGGDGAGGVVGGTLTITDALTIQGDGRILVTGDVNDDDLTFAGTDISDLTNSTANTSDNVRVFVTSAATTLSGLTITGGLGVTPGEREGGGIRATAALTLSDVMVAGNQSTTSGGGVYAASTLTVTDSSVFGNWASSSGGGVASTDSATFTNTTIANNVAFSFAGGVQGSTVSLLNSTVTSNSSGSGAAGVRATTITAENSIVLGNTPGIGSLQLTGTFSETYQGLNIVGVGADTDGSDGRINASSVGQVFAATSVFGGGQIADNGGPVWTVALNTAVTNPALDAASASAPATDARGIAIFDNALVANGSGGAGRDLGAYEASETPSLVVTTLDDVVDAFDGETSLREAIAYANSGDADGVNGAADAITFANGLTGTIRLTATLSVSAGQALSIDGDTDGDGIADITLSGDAGGDDTIVDGLTDIAASTTAGTLTDNVRIILSAAALDLGSLTLTGGVTADSGGAVEMSAAVALTVDRSTIAGNKAQYGGGIDTFGGVTVTNSTISGNVATLQGGGVYATTASSFTNVTVAGNSALEVAGLGVEGPLALTNATVTGNVASSFGGGVFTNDVLTLTNSIVMGNDAPVSVDAEGLAGRMLVGGNILGTDVFSGSTDVGDTSAAAVFAQTHDIGGGVMAGVLADNGGWVATVALNASVTNPAIDASDGSAPATDATGYTRHDNPDVANLNGGAADLGAYEHLNEAPVITLHPSLDVVAAEPDSDGVAIALNAGGFLSPGGGEFTGAGPAHVVLADFNGDGRLDIATGDSTDGTVTVLLQDDCGCFSEASGSPIAVGGTPGGMAVGDLNNDFIPDLVVANTAGTNVTALIGNGDGTFTTVSSNVFFWGPLADIALADFNEDGFLDVVSVGDSPADNAAIAFGNGAGSFTAYSVFSDPASRAFVDVKTGNINGDGHADIVAVDSAHGKAVVLLGAGNGTWAARVELATGDTPLEAAIGDVNGDGNADIVVANSGDSTVGVFLGNGDGTFGTQQTFATLGAPASIALADMDGDGELDIVAAGSTFDTFYGDFVGTFEVLRGNGDGTFMADPFPLIGNFPVSEIAVGNIDAGFEDSNPLFKLFYEGATLQLVPNLVISDVDNTTLAGATVDLGSYGPGGLPGDVLAAVTAGTNITASYDPVNFVLTLSGTDTIANYQAVLRSVTFASGDDPDDSGSFPLRLVGISVDDGTDEGFSAPIFLYITSVADDAFAVVEGGSLAGDLFDANPGVSDSGLLSIAAVNGVAAAVGTQIALASGALLTVNADGTFAYDPNHAFDALPDFVKSGAANTTATDSFTYTIAGGSTATVTITVLGQDSNDLLQGTGAPDTLNGGAGNDTIYGYAGADLMRGGAGDDTYYADDPLDRAIEPLSGIAGGVDTVFSSVDWTLGDNVENLRLVGGAVMGTGNGIANEITGNAIDNLLRGGGGSDTISGGQGNDTINGGQGDDTINGGAGNDTLDGGPGADLMRGGSGDDAYTVDDLLDRTVEALSGPAGGIDIVFSTVDWTLGDNFENLRLLGAASSGTGNGLGNEIVGNALNNLLRGGGGGDTLSGADGNDTVNGGQGDDTLNGGAGNDTLDGGPGADFMRGGEGDDAYYVDDPLDRTIETLSGPAGGIDTVFSAIDRTLGDNLENLRLIGGAVNGDGNGLDNEITGNLADNLLRGRGGDDTISGGEGNDTLNGGNGKDVLIGGKGDDLMNGGAEADTFRFATGRTGTDTIVGFEKAIDRFDLSGGLFTAVSVSSGDTTLTHAGGKIILKGVAGLSLTQWNDLVIPAGTTARSEGAPASSLAVDSSASPHADWSFTPHSALDLAAPVPPDLPLLAHTDFSFS